MAGELGTIGARGSSWRPGTQGGGRQLLHAGRKLWRLDWQRTAGEGWVDLGDEEVERIRFRV
jgi:hypothetical protein